MPFLGITLDISKMNFYNQEFLLEHAQSILGFYAPRVLDPNGGYQQNYFRDGKTFNSELKHLVSSTRMIVNYANAYYWFKSKPFRELAQHGLRFLEQIHWQTEQQGYAWTVLNNRPQDMTQQAYGYAFVLLANAVAFKAGIIKDAGKINTVYELLEQRFWLPEHSLYADEINVDGSLNSYRGQNSNMHLCEAMLAAYQATKQPKFLQRAQTIVQRVAFDLAEQTDGQIWEHFHSNFTPDWEYNKNDPKNLYRPWGFQPGHQTEWAKLLLILNRINADPALITRATELFDSAFASAWDTTYSGLVYGVDPNGKICDDDKYFWVQAESITAAAMLYQETNDEKYRMHYQQLWEYGWEHFVDHEFGAWHRLLDRDNKMKDDRKSIAGAKCDYHTLGMCFDILQSLKSTP